MICLLPLLVSLAGSPGSLDPLEFRKLHRELTGEPVEKWQTIPWKVDLLLARRQALAEGRPLFVWSMNGHPLGCT
jgi:hypothetical protein